jgi:Acetoacetate decarboxylase (ADC)
VPFPSPPWQLRARSWLSVFALRESGRPDRPTGLYAVAFVDYLEGSVLTYHELLVARVLRNGPEPRARITDIWVDSTESMAGGRSLWAIPKQLADLPLHTEAKSRRARTSFRGDAEGVAIGSGVFTSMPWAALLPLPFAASISQLRDDDAEVLTRFRGQVRGVPCQARWRFEPDGPLGWLHGRRPLVSVHLVEARTSFGG